MKLSQHYPDQIVKTQISSGIFQNTPSFYSWCHYKGGYGQLKIGRRVSLWTMGMVGGLMFYGAIAEEELTPHLPHEGGTEQHVQVTNLIKCA